VTSSKPKTILVVEDDPDTLTYFATLLRDHGYHVITAVEAGAALDRVKQGRPDLITLDINLPTDKVDASGVKFYRWMKESEEWKGIPIVIVTGMRPDFEHFISTRRQVPPPDGYVAKPIEEEELLAEVKRHLAA
jgi:CheY-like chemotaxis protein